MVKCSFETTHEGIGHNLKPTSYNQQLVDSANVKTLTNPYYRYNYTIIYHKSHKKIPTQ